MTYQMTVHWPVDTGPCSHNNFFGILLRDLILIVLACALYIFKKELPHKSIPEKLNISSFHEASTEQCDLGLRES